MGSGGYRIASPLDLIRLIAPTTPIERVPQVARGGSGFLYYISRTGVTGARSELRSELATEVGRIKAVVSLPVAVGFGIKTPERAGAIARVADAVVVGSALVDEVAEAVEMNEDVTSRVLSKVASLAKAVRLARQGLTTV